jgi:hypothetical protein
MAKPVVYFRFFFFCAEEQGSEPIDDHLEEDPETEPVEEETRSRATFEFSEEDEMEASQRIERIKMALVELDDEAVLVQEAIDEVRNLQFGFYYFYFACFSN